MNEIKQDWRSTVGLIVPESETGEAYDLIVYMDAKTTNRNVIGVVSEVIKAIEHLAIENGWTVR